jgi:hypothetical protein
MYASHALEAFHRRAAYAQPRQFALTIAVRSWWLYGLRKAEPVEEHKEFGIILDLTRCGQRLNNRAAILQYKIT